MVTLYEAKDFIQSVNKLQIKGSFKSTKAKAVGKASPSILRLTGENNESILIRSGIFNASFREWSHTNHVLPIDSCQDPDLYAAINHVEILAVEALHVYLKSTTSELLLKKSYSPGNSDESPPTAWLVLADDFVAYNWDGSQKYKPDTILGPGKYQLIIRANKIFCRDQEEDAGKYSLMLRVVQLQVHREILSSNEFMFTRDDQPSNDDTLILPLDEEKENDDRSQCLVKVDDLGNVLDALIPAKKPGKCRGRKPKGLLTNH